MSLQDQIANVYDKDSFIKCLNLLAKDSEENPQEWENTTVSQYLQSIASWIEDWSSRYGNEEFEKMDYNEMAKLLYMGKIYE
ncbi:DUF7660 family protein [Pseudobutyrivibrio sp.]|jgi:hypothetical protein|uniref:DUF7660 family protein n=1 Tax=Pseudobutyrivibrio sp. TaxID=2014367 RepID=UPI0025E888A2|nr:hypothetical protein [Pseudobutyrivibrio sp.]